MSSASTYQMSRSRTKLADAATYAVNHFRNSTGLRDRVSVARSTANSDRSRAERIRSQSPTRRFTTLQEESDPRPLYPSSQEFPDSVNSEFTRLTRRAQQTLIDAKPDIDADEHLAEALKQIKLQSDQILRVMGYDKSYAEPVVISECWLSPPDTHNHVSREVSLYFSKNSVLHTPPATEDVSQVHNFISRWSLRLRLGRICDPLSSKSHCSQF